MPSSSGELDKHGICSNASVTLFIKTGGGLISLVTLSLNLPVISLRLVAGNWRDNSTCRIYGIIYRGLDRFGCVLIFVVWEGSQLIS
jgi:hypothetical protein